MKRDGVSAPRTPTPEYRELELAFEDAVKSGLSDDQLTEFVREKILDALAEEKAKRLRPSLN